MDEKFRVLIEGLHEKHVSLISMLPCVIATTPNDCPVGGFIPVFPRIGNPYMQSARKRKIKPRLRERDAPPLLAARGRLSISSKASLNSVTHCARGKDGV